MKKTRISFSQNGESPFQKLLGHNPEILHHWNNLEQVFFSSCSLDPDLLEQVRRTLAFENQCEYCMVKASKPSFSKENLRISYATGFAQFFAMDHKKIEDAHFDMLKEVFNEVEISELCAFISFISASQRLGRIYNLTNAV